MVKRSHGETGDGVVVNVDVELEPQVTIVTWFYRYYRYCRYLGMVCYLWLSLK